MRGDDRLVGNRIKELMEERKVSQVELSEAAGVSQSFISNIIKGFKDPSIVVMKRIADYFKKPIDYFIE